MPEELSNAYLYQSNDANSHLQIKFDGDRRRLVRSNINQLCFLVINIKGRKVTALVHDISEDGAKIETTCFDLPKHFILDNNLTNQRVICEKVWCKNGMSGVKFIHKKHS